MHTISARSIPDHAACEAATRNEHAVDSDSPLCTVIAAVIVVGVLMLCGYAMAGVLGAGVVVWMLGAVVFADWWHDCAVEAREAGVMR